MDDKILHAAFIPFGDIMDIQIPLDYETEKHRGFAFVEFEYAEVGYKLNVAVKTVKSVTVKPSYHGDIMDPDTFGLCDRKTQGLEFEFAELD